MLQPQRRQTLLRLLPSTSTVSPPIQRSGTSAPRNAGHNEDATWSLAIQDLMGPSQACRRW